MPRLTNPDFIKARERLQRYWGHADRGRAVAAPRLLPAHDELESSRPGPHGRGEGANPHTATMIKGVCEGIAAFMESWHSFGARKAFSEEVASGDFEGVYRLVEAARTALWCDDTGCHHQLQKGVFGQTFGAEPLEQMYVRGKLMALHAVGSVRLVQFSVGAEPFADARVSENQAALDAGLDSSGLNALVDPAKGSTDDGAVSWLEPLYFGPTGDVGTDPTRPELFLQPGSAPLEIGYTLPSRTWMHLEASGAVFRWPYRSVLVWLVARVDSPLLRAQFASGPPAPP